MQTCASSVSLLKKILDGAFFSPKQSTQNLHPTTMGSYIFLTPLPITGFRTTDPLFLGHKKTGPCRYRTQKKQFHKQRKRHYDLLSRQRGLDKRNFKIGGHMETFISMHG
jgi:hypothetical protein